MRNFRSIPQILVLSVTCSAVLMAQATLATLTGLVTDTNGAIVPNATIEIVNTATNIKYTVQSNEAGL